MIEYDSFWFTVLIIIGIVFISLAIFYGIKIVYGEPNLDTPCIPLTYTLWTCVDQV